MPRGSRHGYVRARRTRPEGPLCAGVLRGAASTEVERELKSTRTPVCVAGAKVVGGPAWRASGWDLEAPRGGVQLWAHTLRGRCTLNSCLALTPR